MTLRAARTHIRALTIALAIAALLALAACDSLPEVVTEVLPLNTATAEDDGRIAVVADYFRAHAAADTRALADTVVADAREYLETPGLERVSTSAAGQIIDEVWDESTVTFTIDYPSGIKAYSRLILPDSSTSRTIRFENSNDAGAAYEGNVSVTLEGERWVVDAIDGVPIAMVLKGEFRAP
ncbi:MAG: hypothetical protein U1E08_09325 [Coriobacteriia bacterium]|nr:hypothetical protein [Actinomycetota bacterium]MDZ4167876.1 hypothetical protein [Coriobacteriia bacterium]